MCFKTARGIPETLARILRQRQENLLYFDGMAMERSNFHFFSG